MRRLKLNSHKQKILYLVPDLFGAPSGITRYCRFICQALMGKGAHLTIFSLTDKHKPIDDVLQSPNVTFHPCSSSRSLFILLSLWSVLRNRPELILVGHPHYAPLGWLLARFASVRYVVFIYGIDVFKPLAISRRLALQRADRIISISRFTASRAIQMNGIAPDRVRVLYNCLGPKLESPIQPRPSGSNLSMLTVGRLSPYERYKGHDYVIHAMPALLARFPNLVYDVVGDGAWRSDLERLAAQERVAHAIRFHGMVSEEMLRQHYACTDLFIMPSRSEGFGFVFLEAMAHGKPVIGGNLDATPEVIVDGVTGYLVDPKSVDSIVRAASRLLGDDALRRQMGQSAMEHVRQNFSFAKFQQHLSGYLAELS